MEEGGGEGGGEGEEGGDEMRWTLLVWGKEEGWVDGWMDGMYVLGIR